MSLKGEGVELVAKVGTKIYDYITQLVKNGVDPFDIYKETGWKQLEDGQWHNMAQAARQSRRAEQGYGDRLEYHGTSSDIESFDPDKLQSRDFGFAGRGVYTTPDTGVARSYANTASGEGGPNIIPLVSRAQNPMRISLEYKNAVKKAGPEAAEAIRQGAIDNGYDSIEVVLPNGEVLEKVTFDESKLRSINADFDPAKKDSSNLLAGVNPLAIQGGLAAALGGASMLQSEDAEAGPYGDMVKAGVKSLVDRYHGTPHTFDRFDLSKMGSGEGAQAYGWGAYLAGDEGIAKYYRDVLQDSSLIIDGQAIPNYSGGHVDTDAIEKLLVDSHGIDPRDAQYMATALGRSANKTEALDYLRTRAKSYQDSNAHEAAEQMRGIVTKLADTDLKVEKIGSGNLYQAGVPEDADLIDFDLPLFEQEPEIQEILEESLIDEGLINPWIDPPEDPRLASIVQSALEQDSADNVALIIDNDGGLYQEAMEWAQDNGLDLDESSVGDLIAEAAEDYISAVADNEAVTSSGENIYKALSKHLGSDEAASKYLDERGIPGLRFLDAHSRHDGIGKSNYVIWDQDALGPTTKIGATGGLAAGAMFANPDMAEASELKDLQDPLARYLAGFYRDKRDVGGYRNIPHTRLNALANAIDRYDDLPLPVVGADYLGGITDWMRGVSEVRDESSLAKLGRAAIGALDILPY